MFETLNSCRRKVVCAKIMPNVGKNLSWCALLPNFKKNQKRKLVSSQIRLVHFPHLRGQLWGVTTSQIHSLLSIFWHAALHSLVKIRLQDTSLPHFSKTLRSLCLVLSWKAVVKSKNKFNNNLRQGLLFLYVYFLFSIFHSNWPKKRGKDSWVLKKPHYFCAKDLIHTVGNKWDHNTALLKIWRESDKRAILFFQTKKEHKKWNPL